VGAIPGARRAAAAIPPNRLAARAALAIPLQKRAVSFHQPNCECADKNKVYGLPKSE
jgi:hypothetical protein